MKQFLGAGLLLSLLAACSGDKREYIQFPADTISRDLDSVQNFSIVLYDMDVTEEDEYLHKYKIITRREVAQSETPDSAATVSPSDLGFEERITDWLPVSPEDFDFYSSDMGMEIYSKVDGKLSKVTAPPGYSQYVGNEKYGQWQTNPSTGESFWSFYGKYMFISSMFNLLSPVPRGYYTGYAGYRGVAPYYGPSVGGGTAYGTGSAHAGSMNPDYNRRLAGNSRLSQRVQSSVGHSSRATAGKRTAATTPGSSRTSHSSTRYSSAPRSRSKSFGK